MRFKKSVALTALLCGLLVLAPTFAEAAAGSRSSQGSRGSRTSDPGAGRPIERTTTAPQQRAPVAQQPQTAPAAAGGLQQRPSFGMGSPIMTGIMAGLAGSFIGNMLFGSQNAAQAAQNPEASPTGSFIGGMLPFLLIGGIGLLAFMFFRRRSQSQVSPQALARGPVDLSGLRGGPGGGFGAQPPSVPSSDIDVSAADQETFGRLLLDIQSAWGRNDTEALKPLLTSEMAAYFAGQLGELKGKGLANRIEDVTLLMGEGTEAWTENGTDYATARLRWSARDYTVEVATDRVVDGDRQRPVETEEVWTFARQAGDHWRLSAIQQV